MKKCLLFSLIFFAKVAFSQVNDNFEDNNLNQPDWTGSNSGSDFTVENGLLRSNSAHPNSTFYLSTPNALANNCVWEFYCNLKFATSGLNYADVYLVADQQDLQAADLNGYFVRIGGTNDEISLYKRNGSVSTKLIDGLDASLNSSNNHIKIKVVRNAENQFTLQRDLSGTGNSYISEGTATDAAFISSVSFGILIRQSTTSFFQKHFFDDISVYPILTDHTPPKLLSASPMDNNTLEVFFDEAVDPASATNPGHYELNNGYGQPLSVSMTANDRRFVLHFARSFTSGTYVLTATNIPDKNNNPISGHNTASFSYTKPYIAQNGDIVINEILADPNPQTDLPGLEFIELWNTSTEAISIKDWKYSDASSVITLPSYTLDPGGFLILCAKADTNEFKQFGKVLGISPWPALNNAGDILKLQSPQNLTIDSVAFNDSWYKNATKKDGGWTLELIDPRAVCHGIQNWVASADLSGGTPGRRNSVYQANTADSPLALTSALVKDSVTIELTFSRLIDSLSGSQNYNYSINNGLGQPASVSLISPGFVKAELKYNDPISRGKTYQVNVSNITDCSGILISPNYSSSLFRYTDKIQKDDILISEILFNPRPEGVDFVEIYNNSQAELNLQELSIAGKRNNVLTNLKPVSAAQLLIKPGEYIVLTSDPENIKKEYHTENTEAFLNMSSMPPLADEAGTIVLLSDSIPIDELNYTKEMHFALIKDPEGVSLERSSFKRSANEAGNFRSAAASVGFATPGYKNSQWVDEGNNQDEVWLVSTSFSPDNDGFEDALTISYNFKTPGLVANAAIYNDQGKLIRRLVRNSTLAAEGAITWDGLDENSSKANVGVYLVYMDVFDMNGKVKKFRKSCVLASKLN